MDSAQRSELRSRNDALREQVDSMLSALEHQQQQMVEASERVSTISTQAWSADGLVRVTVNAAGIPTDVHLDPESFKRTRPDRLGASMAQAAQAAARQAAQLAQEAIAPIQQIAGDMPDLSDLVPGAPSLRELLNPPQPQAETPEPVPVDEDIAAPILRDEPRPAPELARPAVVQDDDDWGGSILR
ncbi:YbaB/EbfC family nucleoid-associated protein [Aldersonia kunmingensis]|uniref:YbaB/EbfC family nucleoid-associated protein n=1 Tax=Aldersonia kunmingensis TaxID=408066 RepID=UPI0008329980|nr:YbaB/EbfC family nucleoid-associated protein [Aldersonia kunmingensis]